jgi:hypothetical protein
MSLELLLNVGFTESAICSLDITKSKLVIDIKANANISDILYAFVIDNNYVQYIGKTTTPLQNRLSGYVKPGISQQTNKRVNKMIIECLRNGKTISVYTFRGSDIINYRGVNVNLAAGLEDNLINRVAIFNNANNLTRLWNVHGNPFPPVDIPRDNILETQNEEIEAENINYSEAIDITSSNHLSKFSFKLNGTYWNSAVFNVPSSESHLLAGDREPITVRLTNKNGTISISHHINRTANPNGTPRIYLGNDYKNWIHNNFQPEQLVTCTILNPNEIRIEV